MTTTYEEWRVAGTNGGTPFEVIWSPLSWSAFDGGEAEARRFVDLSRSDGWDDGPHLSRRTVTVTEWEATE